MPILEEPCVSVQREKLDGHGINKYFETNNNTLRQSGTKSNNVNISVNYPDIDHDYYNKNINLSDQEMQDVSSGGKSPMLFSITPVYLSLPNKDLVKISHCMSCEEIFPNDFALKRHEQMKHGPPITGN